MKSKELPTIAKNIKKYRQKLDISQDKLSKLADIAYNVIIKIESGATPNPTIETMAKIINHQTTQVNFTLIPRKPINVDVDTTKLKAKLSDIFENSKTILTQFPEIVILFDPNNQISINILRDQNRIIIANNTVTPYSGRPLESFFKFVKEAVDIIDNNEIKDYGFNILSNFDLENGTMDSGDFVKENYIKKEKFDTLGTLKSAGLKVVYEKGYC